MRIRVNPDACSGCRICELACSFHHQKVFAPEGSSIRVYSDYQNGGIRLEIGATCDLCEGENQPKCAQYCAGGAIGREGENEHA